MNDRDRDAIAAALKAQSAEDCRSPEAARAALIRNGFLTKMGNTPANYGGPVVAGDPETGWKEKPDA